MVSPKSPVNTQFSSLQLHFFPLSLLRLLSIVKSGEIASFTKRWFASRVVMSVSFSKSASTFSPKKLNFQNIKAFALPNIIYITGPTQTPESLTQSHVCQIPRDRVNFQRNNAFSLLIYRYSVQPCLNTRTPEPGVMTFTNFRRDTTMLIVSFNCLIYRWREKAF